MRYPTYSGELDSSNPYAAALANAKDALILAEDTFYEDRLQAFDELDLGTFSKTVAEVEEKYDKLLDIQPWEYASEFEDESPTRRTGESEVIPPAVDPTPVRRYVLNQFPTSGITAGDVGSVHGWTVYKDGVNVTSNVLAYHVGRGKNSVDPLYGGLKAFDSPGNILSGYTYTYEIFGETFTGILGVRDSFGEVPLSWNPTANYNSRDLGVMKAAGDRYETLVRSFITHYDEMLALYNGAVGPSPGPGEDETFTGVGDTPWDGFTGSDVSYNRPSGLPNNFVKQVRGV